jgi:hypothetical protein
MGASQGPTNEDDPAAGPRPPWGPTLVRYWLGRLQRANIPLSQPSDEEEEIFRRQTGDFHLSWRHPVPVCAAWGKREHRSGLGFCRHFRKARKQGFEPREVAWHLASLRRRIDQSDQNYESSFESIEHWLDRLELLRFPMPSREDLEMKRVDDETATVFWPTSEEGLYRKIGELHRSWTHPDPPCAEWQATGRESGIGSCEHYLEDRSRVWLPKEFMFHLVLLLNDLLGVEETYKMDDDPLRHNSPYRSYCTNCDHEIAAFGNIAERIVVHDYEPGPEPSLIRHCPVPGCACQSPLEGFPERRDRPTAEPSINRSRLGPPPVSYVGMLLSRGYYCKLCDNGWRSIWAREDHFARVHGTQSPGLSYGFAVELGEGEEPLQVEMRSTPSVPGDSKR